MNGPDHYRLAEWFQREARRSWTSDGSQPVYPPKDQALLMAAAQVSATLALAAATVEAAPPDPASGPLVVAPRAADDVFLGSPASEPSPWWQAMNGTPS